MKNIVMMADSYKYSHASQYPGNMVKMFDYMESRGGLYSETVFVGMSGFLKEYLNTPVTIQMVNQAEAFAKAHGVPFDTAGWEYIVTECDGILPVKIRAVPEGSVIPVKNVLCTIESTDRNVPWIAGFLETILMKLWYPTNIATKSYYTKKMLEKYGSPEWSQFAYHNFGDRGSSSVESAAIGGFAHLTQFMGTDNFNSLLYCMQNYNSNMAGYSVFATEHSTTTSWSKDNEMEFVYQMLLDNPEAPIMSFVADSYDVYKFTDDVTKKGSKVRELIESRPHQKFVLRPDSGEPIEVLSKMVEIMKANGVFDSEIDGKLLSTNFGILWGDGITPEVIEEILVHFTNDISAENFVFGSGGDLMQNHTRDTQRFAVKCSSITLDEGSPMDDEVGDTHWEEFLVQRDVFKDPITDKGKKSKKGEITTYYNKNTGIYFVDKIGQDFEGASDILETVFDNGIAKTYSLDEVRNNAKR